MAHAIEGPAWNINFHAPTPAQRLEGLLRMWGRAAAGAGLLPILPCRCPADVSGAWEMTDWQKLLGSLRTRMSYRKIAETSGIGRDVVYRLAEGKLGEPKHSDGERLLALVAKFIPPISRKSDTTS